MIPRGDAIESSALQAPDVNNVQANASSSNNDPFKYSHGLTGVDQPANYLFVNILITTVLVPVLLTLLFRLLIYFRNDRRRVSVINSCRGQNFWRRDRFSITGSVKKHFLYAPLFGSRHSRELRLTSRINLGTLPARPQLLVIIIYIASNIAYCLAIPEQLPAQRVAELRGRCGALAAFNLIFTILFTLRSNPFIRLLGVSYDTFNLFHRWTARLVILESIGHVAAFMYNTYQVTYQDQDGWSSITWVIKHSVSYQWGLAAFIAMSFILLQSVGPLRHAFYNTFLNLHRIGILVTVLGVYYHLAKHALPQLPWVYLFITLLALEPIIRFGRTVYYNFSCRRQEWTHITVEALPGEASRMEITIPQKWRGTPGCHTYVYLPRLAPLSVHPFSVAWYTNPEDARPDYEKAPLSLDDHEVEKGPTTISCIVRARKGMTRTLYDRASKAKTGRITLWGAIEGFHSATYSLDSYGTIVLFAAGAGITHQMPFVKHLLGGYNHDTTATRRILLVWCIPDIQCVDWIQPWLEELAIMPNFSEVVQVRLHVSRPTSKPAKALPLQDMADIIFQRCKPQEIVDEQIMAQIGAMAVTVCGPGGFNDSVRAAVRRRVGLRSIDFFEEAFSS
jgi:hypothetical protein